MLSLARSGCLYHGTVQHELLHALGFNHEQTRSDRDNHIRVLLNNVQSGKRTVLFQLLSSPAGPLRAGDRPLDFQGPRDR